MRNPHPYPTSEYIKIRMICEEKMKKDENLVFFLRFWKFPPESGSLMRFPPESGSLMKICPESGSFVEILEILLRF